MRHAASFVVAFVLFNGCDGDCETERCASGRTYQSCVIGKALVIRDDQGKEFSRCEPDYGPGAASGVYVGTDKNDCALKHSESRDAICDFYASGPTGGGGGGVGGGTGGGGATGSAHCYKKTDNSYCDCFNTDQSFGYPASEYVRTTSCAGIVGPVCCVSRDSSNRVTSCSCTSQPRACREDGNKCSCPLANASGDPTQVRTSCEPSGGRICCISNSYCTCRVANDCFGFGGLNENATRVSSCTAPAVAIDWCHGEEKSSCDGLVWAP
ncbi:MAG: hypothetical protein QM817_04315 [Archangium sp.]